jgi:hypothetical protein
MDHNSHVLIRKHKGILVSPGTSVSNATEVLSHNTSKGSRMQQRRICSVCIIPSDAHTPSPVDRDCNAVSQHILAKIQ